MIRDFKACFTRSIVFLLLWHVYAFTTSCRNGPQKQEFEETAVPFVQHAYAIKDSASIVSAFRYIDSVRAVVPFVDIDLYAIYTFKHNCYLNDIQNPDSALKYADSMLAVIKRNSDYDWDGYKLVNAYNAKADAYYFKGNYKEAYAWYSRNKQQFNDDDSCLSGSYNFRIAMSLYKEERYDEAATYFKLSFAQQQACEITLPQLIRMQEILSNTGLCYYHSKKYDSARYYYTLAEEYITSHKNSFPHNEKAWQGAIAVIYGNTGRLQDEINKPDSAVIYFKKSISIDDTFSVNRYDMLTVRTYLANLYTKQKNYDEALDELNVIGATNETNTLPEIAYQYEEALWQYHKSTGNTSKAFEHIQRYIALKDSVSYNQKKALVNDLRKGMLETEQEYEKEIYEHDIEISRVTILALVSLTITTLLIIIWLVRVVFRRKKTIKEQHELLQKIAWLQSHEMRKPVATMKGLMHVFNKTNMADPNNTFIINSIEEQLDEMDNMIREINEKAKTGSP